jgi:hypothetical protein
MRSNFLVLVLILTTMQSSAIVPLRIGLNTISERKCNGIPSIKCLYPTGTVSSDSLAEPMHAMTMPILVKRIALMMPPVELGFFCLLELRLEKKFKLPVNFELR